MYLSESCFVLMGWLATSALGDYEWAYPQSQIQLNRATGIPVVGPSVFMRPNKFRNPSTTRRPFRRRPATTQPQLIPSVVPQTTTSRPMIVLGPPPLPSPDPVPSQGVPNLSSPVNNVPYDGEAALSYPGTIQFSSSGNNGGTGSIVPQNTPSSALVERPPAESLMTTQQPQDEPYFPAQPPDSFPSIFPPSSSFTPNPTQQPVTPNPTLPYQPQKPLVFPVVRPPAFMPSTIPKPSFKPPQSSSNVPPKNPNAQPPFDSGPYVPPKPPPVPATSTTGVNPAPPSGKPQRPLPPSRPILHRPPSRPPPSFQLTTTEKPNLIYNESSMSDDGNYTFDFLVSNSVYRREQGFLKKSLVKPWGLILVKTGAYSFTSPEGTLHRIDFVADENGYRAFESSS
ncbi:hypothetical protein GE061_019105 [Apolygus lucorum]|uniref:Uncharacterized protein n=1 Tax=Apolygus lucorum TaxID=248454 RepID=A0A6A4JWL9_APOLU|nr:hypothetical protein GE061_019105 [Apolygus lucorum]